MVGIYLIRNRVSGKCYVGKSMDIQARWKKHIAAAKKPKMYISRAIAKYGEEQFEFSVLEECTAEQLNDREIHWIKELDTYNTGYNSTLGGEGSNKGKDSYSAEYHRAATKAYRDTHKDDQEFKENHKAANKKIYDKVKDDPEFKRKNRYVSKAWYDKVKDDPEFKEKRNAAKKKRYDKLKYDPEFKRKNKAKSMNYYYSHRFKPTPDHTDMPLW